MKIGYPCINNSIGCTTNKTFRLASYSEDRLKETVAMNLACLQKTLEYNVEHDLMFFRMSSAIVPFASHVVCEFDWKTHFADTLKSIGDYIKEHNFRISMHPDQFVLINAQKQDIVDRSIDELIYHCDFMDLMGLDATAKVQIHVGGVYGDKEGSINRFIDNYKKLPEKITKRLAIENDHNSYTLQDCLKIHEATGIPIIFDTFHHECVNNGETIDEAMRLAAATWKESDGIMMIDYSTQKPDGRRGSHAHDLDEKLFEHFLDSTRDTDCDIMLEIKNKEKVALRAHEIARELKRV